MIEIRAKRFLWLMLFSMLGLTVLAQEKKTVKVNTGDEKVYFHFDRPYYNAGDTAWFKAYLYKNRLPSAASTELFLQVQDMAGKIIGNRRYPVLGSTITGHIIFSDTLLSGYYAIKAISKTMAQSETGFFYEKNMFVFNASDIKRDTVLPSKVFLQFFPESGHLINRIRTQVAFKSTDENGNPLSVKGEIKTNDNRLISNFATLHDGIGRTSFTPHLTDTLFAEVTINDKKYNFPLPPVKASGINLKISTADSGRAFELTRSRTDMQLFDTLRFLVKMNNDTVFQNIISFGDDQVLTGFLKTNGLPSGILHFIVFNKEGMPLSERLSFLNNREYLLKPEISTMAFSPEKRASNSIEILFGDTTQRSLSISVTDADAQDFPDKENILSSLLLTSDLKGKVYNPSWYFNNDNELGRLAMDNLMLTHGWTRYNWIKPAAAEVSGSIVNDDHFLITISGTVKDQKKQEPLSTGSLSFQILSADSSVQFVEALVDENGKFKLDSMLFFGKVRIYYTYSNASGKKMPVNILLDSDAGEEYFNIMSKAKNGNNVYQPLQKELASSPGAGPGLPFESKFKQLSTVFLKTTIRRPVDRINEKYASPLFRSSGKMILDNINNPYNNRSLNVVNYVLTNIPSLAYDPGYDALVNRKNFSLQSQRNWIVEFLVDESAVSLPMANSITMDRVAMIKFYEAGFVGVGTQTPGGALAVYLKKSDDEQPSIVPSAQKYITYQGYEITKEFYEPQYASALSLPKSIDNRQTLYWSNVVSSGAGSEKVRINFNNNDFSKKLTCVVEGFDEKGKLIHIEKILGD